MQWGFGWRDRAQGSEGLGKGRRREGKRGVGGGGVLACGCRRSFPTPPLHNPTKPPPTSYSPLSSFCVSLRGGQQRGGPATNLNKSKTKDTHSEGSCFTRRVLTSCTAQGQTRPAGSRVITPPPNTTTTTPPATAAPPGSAPTERAPSASHF